MVKRICTYCVLLLLLCSPAYAGPGRLSGSAEIRYAQLTAEENGKTVLDANHFIQSYSLLWRKAGEISNGRAGQYNVALGYEWNWIDSEVNGAEVDFDNPLDKILFRGDLLLAPGGLPFQMHLYSQDMGGTGFSDGLRGELFEADSNTDNFGIVNSFQNGSHITTGMTLVAGVKNGSYRGLYRDLFTSMPKLYVDFRQDEVRNVDGVSQIDYVDRNLAFVSLNKNKNWFHYRFFTHEDKTDSSNDYQRQTYLIGTIDHVDQRQWIDLTNWIKISTDLSYAETTSEVNANEPDSKRYDFNFFTTAKRSSWSGGAYTHFSRVRDGNSLDKSWSVPIVANGRLNGETTWRLRFENQQTAEDVFASTEDKNKSNWFLSSRLDMFSQSRYMISPKLEVEYKDSWDNSGYALRAGVEAYNNKRYRTDSDLFGAYSVALFKGDGATYLEQQLDGRYAKDLSTSSRYEVEQRFIFGTGEYDGGITDYIAANISALSVGSGESSNYYRSISRLTYSYRPANRIYHRFSINYDYIDSIKGSDGKLAAIHNVNYYGGALRAALTSELIWEGSLHDSFQSDVDLSEGSSVARQEGAVDISFESVGRLDYKPDSRNRHSLDMEVEWRRFVAGGSDQRYKFTQLYEHAFYKERGLRRRIAIVGEEFEYEDYSASLGSSSSLLSFTLFSELYPTRNTLLGARLRYEIDTTEETDTMLVYLTAGVDFSKFQMEFDYAYGTRTAGLTQPERIEHKWEMKVKKIF